MKTLLIAIVLVACICGVALGSDMDYRMQQLGIILSDPAGSSAPAPLWSHFE